MQIIKSILLILIISLSGCTDPLIAKIEQQTPITQQRLAQLATALNDGQVRNATLINQYGDSLLETKPDLKPLINEFKKDATTDGPMFKGLQDRLKTVQTQPQMFADNKAIFDELISIYQAADPQLYSDALSDPLNVLADMSDGVLPRVNSLSKEQSMQANKAQDFGYGEQLIGNPSYGQWQTGSNGMSFWAWYGMYSMMGDLFGNRRVYYSNWGSNRGFSYYNDYGRSRYTSPSQFRKQASVETRTRKSFASSGKKYQSPYSKSRTGSSGLSRQSQSAKASSDKFRQRSNSSYASKSKYSNKASFRNSRSKTSRGFSRGK